MPSLAVPPPRCLWCSVPLEEVAADTHQPQLLCCGPGAQVEGGRGAGLRRLAGVVSYRASMADGGWRMLGTEPGPSLPSRPRSPLGEQGANQAVLGTAACLGRLDAGMRGIDTAGPAQGRLVLPAILTCGRLL